MKQQKLAKFNKIFPWYAGLSSDLLFWIAIDTLFLTVVKHLNTSQIESLVAIPMIICIIMQIPLLKIIKKIGNTNSVKLGSALLLISSLLLTFGQNYISILLGKISYEIAFTFLNMANVILRNNLELQGKSDDYIKIQTKGITIYSTITMIISFIASVMFNLNNYLPMLGCITFCIIVFILSFYIIDYSNYNKVEEKIENKTNKKIKYSKLIIILIISFSIFFPIVNCGQADGKLFIQQELLLNFDVEKTALIIGIILSVSRIVRVISNMSFNKIYNKYKDKVGIMLTVLLSLSITFMLFGSFITNNLILKFSIMSLGYIILLFIRDSFRVYMQDLALKNVDKKGQQSILVIMDLSRRIIRAIISLSFTIILLNSPIITVMSILLILSIIGILISIKLYKLVLNKER